MSYFLFKTPAHQSEAAKINKNVNKPPLFANKKYILLNQLLSNDFITYYKFIFRVYFFDKCFANICKL